MTTKRKFAYFIVPAILICATGLFFILNQNEEQESHKVYKVPSIKEKQVVQENKQDQAKNHRDESVDSKTDDVKEVADDVEVIFDSNDMQSDDPEETMVKNTPIEVDSQVTSDESSDKEKSDSESREIPKLSDIHLKRPHYKITLDNGTVFDSRKSRETVFPDDAVISGSLEDIRETVRKLEKKENKSPLLKAYIETLKRAENP